MKSSDNTRSQKNSQNPEESDNVEQQAAHSENSSADNASTNEQDKETNWEQEYLYLKAEYDNYKKHSIKERSDLLKYGSERVISELTNILDIFDQAISEEITEANMKNIFAGIKMTADELKNILEKFGLKEEPLQNTFDPKLHEALSTEETNEHPEGTITQVYKKAYRLHDKLIRPAQVAVACAPKSENPSGDKDKS